MKPALVVLGIVGAFLLAVWVVGFVAATAAWNRAGEQPWPAGLGTLKDVERRYPPHGPSAAALRLAELTRPIGIDFAVKKAPEQAWRMALAAYVQAEQVRATLLIGAPSAELASFLTTHEQRLDVVRDHLNGRSEDIVWTMDLAKGLEAPVPGLQAHLTLARLFTARALLRGRSQDIRAWDDLHAASALAGSLRRRPELICQLMTLAVARMVNAAAWKLPLPPPEWLRNTQQFDYRNLFIASIQFDAWQIWRHAEGSMKGVSYRAASPYIRMGLANLALHQRDTASEAEEITECGFDGPAFYRRRIAAISKWNVVARISVPNISAAWSRVQRFVAEREATANALRIRAGAPFDARSRCTDGAWAFANGKLSFTREIDGSADRSPPMPLTLTPLP